MLRVYKHDTDTWRALRVCRALCMLEQKVDETPALHNKRVQNGGSVVVCDPYSIVYVYVRPAEHGVQEHVMWDEEDTYFAPVRGGVLVRTQNGLYEHEGPVQGNITNAYVSPALRRIERGSGPNKKFVENGKPFLVRIHRFVIMVLPGVSHVLILNRPKSRSVQPCAPPKCVNACFTTAVDGSLACVENLNVLTESTCNGVCGSSHTASTLFGVLEIFPLRLGLHKVIGKGYQTVRDMQYDITWLCRLTGTHEAGSISMHMCIFKASTGTRLDIAENGFVHQYFAKNLVDAHGPVCTFRPPVPELDVHCIVEVDDIHRLALCLPGDSGAYCEQVAQGLRALRMFVSCTGMGVCIFRIARKEEAACLTPDRVESSVQRVTSALHALLCEFPGA